MWPEKVMTRGRTASNAIVKFVLSGYGSTSVTSGETFVYHNTVGSTNIVHATASKNWKPSKYVPVFHRFEAMDIEHTVSPAKWEVRKPHWAGGAYDYFISLDGPLTGAYWGNAVPTSSTAPQYQTDLYNSVVGPSIRQAFERFNTPNIMGGVALAEGMQTLRMLANPMQGLQRLLGDMVSHAKKRTKRPGSKTPAHKTLDALSESWLEYRYGVMPLIYDLSALIEGYRKRRLEYNTIRGKSTLKITSYPLRNTRIGSLSNLTLYGEERREVVLKANTVLAYRDNLRIPDWKWHLWENGFDPSQIPVAVWELIPLSFVVDWLIDVGGFITSLQVNPVRDFLGQCTSYKEVTKRTRYITSVRDSWGGSHRPPANDKWVATSSTLIRRVDEEVSLGARLLNPKMSWKRQVDALSLLWGRMPKQLRSRTRM